MSEQSSAAYAALVLRVATGVLFVAHGLLKVLVFSIPGTVAYFESIGYPGLFAYPVIAGELLGGAALILGVQTRLVSLALIPLLIGAALQHVGNGWVFSAEGGGWEFPVYWTVVMAVQALLGPGAFALRIGAVDRLLARVYLNDPRSLAQPA
jgi:putative oxidoreductase